MSFSSKKYIQHLITPRTVTVVFDVGDPVSIVRGDNNAARFDKVVNLLRSRSYQDIPEAVDRALQVSVVSRGKFTVKDGCVVIDGVDLPNSLSDKLLDMVDESGDTTPLERFWDNLKENPSSSSREDLYSFLDYNNVPITQDGCFVVYKKVKDDFWDNYTGKTHQNKPGNVIEMPRDKVDQNRNNTCSAGLHVAAFEYAQDFSGSRLLECKVNPKDVVAVPPDYNNQKMRVCRYEVVCETTTKYVAPVYCKGSQAAVLGGGVFKPIKLSLDARGRLRIPGVAIRRLGLGVGASVVSVVTTTSSRHLLLQNNKDFDTTRKYHSTTKYTVESDNSVRVSSSFLSKAKLNGHKEYTVRLKGNNLEIRVSKASKTKSSSNNNLVNELTKRDSRGRLCVPNSMVRKLGISSGDIAYLHSDGLELTVTPYTVPAAKYLTALKVDKDDNIRITCSALDKAGISRNKTPLAVSMDTVGSSVIVTQ